MNIWVPEKQYIDDYNKIKFLEIELLPEKNKYTSYWCYSFYL